MREGLLIQKKEDEEMQKLQDLATGGRDPSEFLKWQHSMRQKDLDNKLADIEARRLDGKLSYEEAILARQTLIDENKQRVQDIKKEVKRRSFYVFLVLWLTSKLLKLYLLYFSLQNTVFSIDKLVLSYAASQLKFLMY